MGETNFLLFLAASLSLIMTPGPDKIYVATRGISRGRGGALIDKSRFAGALRRVTGGILVVLGLRPALPERM